MKHLWQWVLFEFVAFNVSVACAYGCGLGSFVIFSSISLTEPIWLLIKGILGISLVLLGVGFLWAMGFIVFLGFYVNLDFLYEEKEFNRK